MMTDEKLTVRLVDDTPDGDRDEVVYAILVMMAADRRCRITDLGVGVVPVDDGAYLEVTANREVLASFVEYWFDGDQSLEDVLVAR